MRACGVGERGRSDLTAGEGPLVFGVGRLIIELMVLIPNEASPQTSEVYGKGRGKGNRIDGGLRSSRQGRCPGHESSKLGGSQDPWTTGVHNEHSTIGGGRIA